MIDWYNITRDLFTKQGKAITADESIWNMDNPEYSEIYTIWKNGNINLSSVKWINYYPKVDFSNSVIDEFSETMRVKPLRAWISRIDPGYCAPLHYDVDDNEAEYITHGQLRRFTCFIMHPMVGHIMAIDNQYYYNQPLGTTIEWPDYKAWHGAMNAGLRTNYMFHLLGY
jgi:hypothetical protein